MIEKFYDPKWSDDLRGQFSTVVLDEAQTVKNPLKEVFQTIAWLNADFHIFMSATPLLAGATDCLGFMRLVEPVKAGNL